MSSDARPFVQKVSFHVHAATVSSRCECQASLQASVDDQGVVRAGSAGQGSSDRTTAPAQVVARRDGPTDSYWDVAWLCPFCGRNVLRTVARSSLSFSEIPSSVS